MLNKDKLIHSIMLDAQNVPRLRLLSTTCSNGFDAVAYLVPEFHRARAVDACSRFQLWRADLFLGIHLDELLEAHVVLRRHILGVLADIAVILESLLSAFTNGSSDFHSSNASLRRLRIALGQNDVSSVLTDVDETEEYFDNPSDWTKEQLDIVEDLVECLYDSLFTISMASKLEQAKSMSISTTSAGAVRTSDERVDDISNTFESRKGRRFACLRKSLYTSFVKVIELFASIVFSECQAADQMMKIRTVMCRTWLISLQAASKGNYNATEKDLCVIHALGLEAPANTKDMILFGKAGSRV